MPGTVTVACKLPNGLKIHLLNKDSGLPEWECILAGGRVRRNQETGMPLMGGPEIVGDPMDGGFGLTPDVDADKFERWLSEYKSFEPVRKGLIFAAHKPAEVVAQAKDKADLKTGLEPVSQAKAKGVEPMTKN